MTDFHHGPQPATPASGLDPRDQLLYGMFEAAMLVRSHMPAGMHAEVTVQAEPPLVVIQPSDPIDAPAAARMADEMGLNDYSQTDRVDGVRFCNWTGTMRGFTVRVTILLVDPTRAGQ